MKNLISILILFFPLVILAQEKHSEMDSVRSNNTLGEVLKSGDVDFHIRSFFMGTRNRGDLLNYSTMAVGAGIGYYSPSFKGFHVGFSGFFVFQLFEQNVRIADPTTGNINRYEILLYDMNDLENTRDLDRLEHLYLSYLNGGFQAVLGRQSVNSPLLNEQDNRMRPNTFSGLALRYKDDGWDLYSSWFHQVTMRGTVDWYRIEESFGVYPFGRSPFGEASLYKGNIESRGLGILGMKKSLDQFGSVEIWNYWAENVFNTSFIQSDGKINLGKTDLNWGIQGFYQTPTGSGGNETSHMAYIMPNEVTYGMGSRLQLNYQNQRISMNFLGISDKGRFLFPREWGRERFYASLPRERFEGNGGVIALTAKYDWSPSGKSWKGSLGASSVHNPDIRNYHLNKYGVPSYYHFVAEADYKFNGYLKGLDMKFILVNKTAKNPHSVPDRFRINRVDLWNVNMVMDYRF
ncbi:MAG TPA: OprD family outer membrane porin [Anditalea sp.]|nr:OprD family outer membrane porin [Anditalea sp.]